MRVKYLNDMVVKSYFRGLQAGQEGVTTLYANFEASGRGLRLYFLNWSDGVLVWRRSICWDHLTPFIASLSVGGDLSYTRMRTKMVELSVAAPRPGMARNEEDRAGVADLEVLKKFFDVSSSIKNELISKIFYTNRSRTGGDGVLWKLPELKYEPLSQKLEDSVVLFKSRMGVALRVFWENSDENVYKMVRCGFEDWLGVGTGGWSPTLLLYDLYGGKGGSEPVLTLHLGALEKVLIYLTWKRSNQKSGQRALNKAKNGALYQKTSQKMRNAVTASLAQNRPSARFTALKQALGAKVPAEGLSGGKKILCSFIHYQFVDLNTLILVFLEHVVLFNIKAKSFQFIRLETPLAPYRARMRFLLPRGHCQDSRIYKFDQILLKIDLADKDCPDSGNRPQTGLADSHKVAFILYMDHVVNLLKQEAEECGMLSLVKWTKTISEIESSERGRLEEGSLLNKKKSILKGKGSKCCLI